jgi:hypothetical protein
VPFGLDASARLIALARRRHPACAAHFWTGNAWSWQPPRRFTYVYTLADVVPPTLLGAMLRRMHADFVEPGGRLIVGAYGSRSRGLAPLDLAPLLASLGLPVAGTASGGADGITRFAWVERA